MFLSPKWFFFFQGLFQVKAVSKENIKQTKLYENQFSVKLIDEKAEDIKNSSSLREAMEPL